MESYRPLNGTTSPLPATPSSPSYKERKRQEVYYCYFLTRTRCDNSWPSIVRQLSTSFRAPSLLPLPGPEQISIRLLAEQQAPGVTEFLLGTYPDEVRTAPGTYKPNDVVTLTFRLGHAVLDACAQMWLYLCARDVGEVWDLVSSLLCTLRALVQSGWQL